MTGFTAEEKLEAIRRELKQRRRVYPRLIEQGKLSPSFAARQIEIMEAIEADYVEKVRGERLI